MTRYVVTFEELWEPWGIEPYNGGRARHHVVDLPDDLVSHFKAAKEELENAWTQINNLIREAEDA